MTVFITILSLVVFVFAVMSNFAPETFIYIVSLANIKAINLPTIAFNYLQGNQKGEHTIHSKKRLETIEAYVCRNIGDFHAERVLSYFQKEGKRVPKKYEFRMIRKTAEFDTFAALSIPKYMMLIPKEEQTHEMIKCALRAGSFAFPNLVMDAIQKDRNAEEVHLICSQHVELARCWSERNRKDFIRKPIRK